jgi:hypothetical protein
MDDKTRKILNEYLQIVKLLRARCTFESCSCEFKGPYSKVDKARHEGEMALVGEIVRVSKGVKNG